MLKLLRYLLVLGAQVIVPSFADGPSSLDDHASGMLSIKNENEKENEKSNERQNEIPKAASASIQGSENVIDPCKTIKCSKRKI